MNEIRNVSLEGLNNIISKNNNYQIVDLRIFQEQSIGFNNVTHIPFDKLTDNIEKISKEKKVIFICDNGANSFFAVKILQELYNFNNLYNFKGGLNQMTDNNEQMIENKNY